MEEMEPPNLSKGSCAMKIANLVCRNCSGGDCGNDDCKCQWQNCFEVRPIEVKDAPKEGWEAEDVEENTLEKMQHLPEDVEEIAVVHYFPSYYYKNGVTVLHACKGNFLYTYEEI